jgi:hypothetical protein
MGSLTKLLLFGRNYPAHYKLVSSHKHNDSDQTTGLSMNIQSGEVALKDASQYRARFALPSAGCVQL